MAILEARDLCAGYGTGDVVKNVRMSLEKGEFVSVLGPNGSGKSTLIKALQGLLRYVAGEVTLAGESIWRLRRREIARWIAFVPQISDPVFDFSVFELVAMGRYAYQTRISGLSPSDLRLIREVLKLVGISRLEDKKIAHLSGGERQRVLIARALAQDTPLLFLDEPSSHLDINYGLEIFEILLKLQREKGKTILCTEHNINLAVPYSQRIIFLKAGEIQAQGAPSGLITRESIKDIFQVEVDIRQNPHSLLPEISLIPRIGKRE
jgi:iron complex transport system ATP-binding protein